MHQTFSPEDYNRYIRTLCPEYDLFNHMMAKIVERLQAKTIVSLGCGPGNLERMIQTALPHARVIGIDQDEAVLAYLNQVDPRIETVATSLADYSYPEADVYIAGTSLHHLNGERKTVYQMILANAKTFINFEMFAGCDEIIRNRLEPNYSFDDWKQESAKVDHFRTIPEEMAELSSFGVDPKLLLRDDPFALYLVHTRT
jgi:trans-aconitate methyltransferase